MSGEPVVSVRLTRGELAAIRRAAGTVPTSRYIRQAALAAARRLPSPPYFTCNYVGATSGISDSQQRFQRAARASVLPVGQVNP